MGDTVDIQNLLQAGYFKSSRSRSKSPAIDQLGVVEDTYRPERSRNDVNPRARPRDSPSPIRLPPPPTHNRAGSRSRPSPPPPTVDDEDTIITKEHGYCRTVIPEEEASSRGDADQNPAIMEVHEFNPERRFVIIDDDQAAVANGDSSDFVDEKSNPIPPKPSNSPPAPRPSDPVPHHRRAPSDGLSPPSTGRRRSRQDLPVLDTELCDHRQAEHHRSRSAVNGPRPDYFNSYRPSRPSRQYGDQLLSPDIMKQSSRGREEDYYSGEYRDRPREKRYSRISPEHSTRRSETGPEYRPPRRPISNDRDGDRINREYYSSSLRDENSTRPVQSFSRDSTKSSARISREHSRSKDEHPKPVQPLPTQKPLVVQEDRELDIHRAPEPEQVKLEKIPSRSGAAPIEKTPSRTSTMPIPKLPNYDTEQPPMPRSAATFSVSKHSETTVQSPLPYPEEDGFHIDPLSMPPDARRSIDGPAGPIYMPKLPPESSTEVPERRIPPDSGSSQSDSKPPEVKEWKPPSFDPEKHGAIPDRPVGTYRRYSENRENEASDRLPNCPRMKPVTGKVDWLTLPRTDFNICPECYGQVFSNSDYRTHFHPVLRSTVDPISCDFGSSPWYRIAWLLILKKKSEDLQVFHDISAVSSAARSQRCPGDRRTTRDWYTIKDPYTKRPVPEFTVCYQCAKTVEALLPTLCGIFGPLESRSSPVRSSCALHFAPDRTDFVLYFDSFETTADRAQSSKNGPDLGSLAQKLERLSVHNECREDKPVVDGYWHFMQFLPEFTVCGDCFEDVVRPRLTDENVIARNFYIKPQKISHATCQLYSARMRDIFKRACRRNDPKYLETKVRERLAIESSIKNKLSKLDREGQRDVRTEKQIDDLIEQWKEWE